MIRRLACAAAPLAAALAAACGSSAAVAPTPTPTPQAAFTLPESQAGTPDLLPILGTTVLRVGPQRVAFLLEAPTALVTAPTADVTAVFEDTAAGAPSSTATATFHPWPFGTRGTYVTELAFDRPGPWRLDITVDDEPFVGEAALPLEVAETSVVRDIGALAPFSNNKTVETVGGDLSALTTHSQPDPDLYQATIAESLFSGTPTVIVFASPTFCTTPSCGPQVETVIDLKDAHRGEATFIHVEVYDNPLEIQGDLSRAVFSPLLAQWGIDAVPHYLNESWVFVLGRDGRIASRFEGYATLTELEAALQRVL